MRGDGRRRGSYSKAFKRRVVAETLQPGAAVASIALAHGLNANMVFRWRRDPRFGPGRDAALFLPVDVLVPEEPVHRLPTGGRAAGSDLVTGQASPEGGRIELALASGHRLVLSGGFDIDTVLCLVRGLERS